jgi:hypothetical protein
MRDLSAVNCPLWPIPASSGKFTKSSVYCVISDSTPVAQQICSVDNTLTITGIEPDLLQNLGFEINQIN